MLNGSSLKQKLKLTWGNAYVSQGRQQLLQVDAVGNIRHGASHVMGSIRLVDRGKKVR
jgi:hypothetical protein